MLKMLDHMETHGRDNRLITGPKRRSTLANRVRQELETGKKGP